MDFAINQLRIQLLKTEVISSPYAATRTGCMSAKILLGCQNICVWLYVAAILAPGTLLWNNESTVYLELHPA